MYQAVVVTNDGTTFRAVLTGPRTVAVVEDGLDGLADLIEFPEDDRSSLVPEGLPNILIDWIYEMRRGLSISNITLSLR